METRAGRHDEAPKMVGEECVKEVEWIDNKRDEGPTSKEKYGGKDRWADENENNEWQND